MMESMTQVGSSIAGLLIAYKMLENFLPYEILHPIRRKFRKLTASFDPYLEITIPEYQGGCFERSSAYASIEQYLNIIATKQAQCLEANITGETKKVVLTMAEGEEITDEYKGIKLWWESHKATANKQTISMYPRDDEQKYFKLTFHKRYRETVTEQYLKHVLDEGKAIQAKVRQRKLYTNIKRSSWGTRSLWSHVVFEHPASFDTIAMDPLKKQEIMDDLMIFAKGKDYYAKIGKAWKRGYLLYGPPGTGKSTMIAAMANLLKYDIYDLELTSVKDNTQLRKLLIETSGKSIIVIEDIDCSLDLTGQRKKKEENDVGDNEIEKEKKDEASKVNLMPKSGTGEGKESSLLRLIQALEDVKEKEIDKKLKAEQLLNKNKLRKMLIDVVVGRNSLTKSKR